jgi:hypothetical protein
MAGFVALLVLVLGTATVRAEVVTTLYQAEVLVASQGETARREAASQGLAEIVVRVSGVPTAMEIPRIQGAMAKPLKLLEAFHYESTDELLQLDEVEVQASRLILKFSPSAIGQLLRDAGLPVWPANRPSLLVWLVQDDPIEGRRLVSSVEQAEVLAAIDSVAEVRGLPLIMPLLDLQDQMSIDAEQLWSLDQQVILQASSRYQADAVVVGRFTQTSAGQWRSTWLLLHKDSSEVFDSRGLETAAWVNDGLGEIANYLAGLYGIVPQLGGTDAVVMELQGVHNFADYFQALTYLESLAMIDRAEPKLVADNVLRLYLYNEGSVSLLLDALALDNKLMPQVETSPLPVVSLPGAVPQWQIGPQGSPNNPLRYVWGS